MSDMTEYVVTIKNGDYPLTYRAKTITDAFMCLIAAEQNHHLDNLPSFMNRDSLMENLVQMKNNHLNKTETMAYALERVVTEDQGGA